MEPIELMACMGCQRVVDQYTFPANCPKCNSRFHKKIKPAKSIILKWVLTHPLHVTKLFIQDIREKYHAYKS